MILAKGTETALWSWWKGDLTYFVEKCCLLTARVLGGVPSYCSRNGTEMSPIFPSLSGFCLLISVSQLNHLFSSTPLRGLDRTLLLVPLLGDGRFWFRTVWEISWTLELDEKKNRWCACSMKQNGTSPWDTNHQLYFQPVGILTGLHFSQVWVGEHFKWRNFNTEKKLCFFPKYRRALLHNWLTLMKCWGSPSQELSQSFLKCTLVLWL